MGHFTNHKNAYSSWDDDVIKFLKNFDEFSPNFSDILGT